MPPLPAIMGISRRTLVTGLGGTLVLPHGAAALTPPTPNADARLLVVIELRGGNDGLDTLVPWTHAVYRKARPNLALGPDRVIPITDGLGFHQALAPLMPAWQAGEMAVVQGLGYPDPSHSHFRSLTIWDTASGAHETRHTGWLARALDGATTPPIGTDGTAILFGLSAEPPGPLLGLGDRIMAINETTWELALAEDLPAAPAPADLARPVTPELAHILTQRRFLLDRAAAVAAAHRSSLVPLGLFPDTPLGRHLRDTARLLIGGLRPSVIKLAVGDFDTHSAQDERHPPLLAELAQGIAGLRDALVAASLWDRTVVMTYSEFGRRVFENGSMGTDHGTAACQFVVGGRVAGGLHGLAPSLDDLVDGDLKHTVDFRAYYAGIARDWLGLPDAVPGVGRLSLFA